MTFSKVMKERDPERIDGVLVALRILWARYPDLRFGQLLSYVQRDIDADRSWQMEDDEWLEVLMRILNPE